MYGCISLPPHSLHIRFVSFFQAAARLATKTQRDAQATLETEKNNTIAELQQQLNQALQELRQSQAAQTEHAEQAARASEAASHAEQELLKERERLARDAEDESERNALALETERRRAEQAEQAARVSVDKVCLWQPWHIVTCNTRGCTCLYSCDSCM